MRGSAGSMAAKHNGNAAPTSFSRWMKKVQYIAERELAAAIAKTRAIAGTVVVMNPNTGRDSGAGELAKFNPNAASDAPAEARMNRGSERTLRAGVNFQVDHPGGGLDQGSQGRGKFSIAKMARSMWRAPHPRP